MKYKPERKYLVTWFRHYDEDETTQVVWARSPEAAIKGLSSSPQTFHVYELDEDKKAIFHKTYLRSI